MGGRLRRKQERRAADRALERHGVDARVAARHGGYGLSDVAATSAKNVWILGSAILHWNGRKWTCALLPKKHSPGNLFAISSSSAGNAWAVGDSGSGTGILALHWNGHSWTQVMTPQTDPASALFGAAAIPQSGRAWAVGRTGWSRNADVALERHRLALKAIPPHGTGWASAQFSRV